MDMVTAVDVLALALGAAFTLLALASLRGTLHFSRLPVEPASAWRPRATVIVPARGEQQGFSDNVRALAQQEYPGYDLLFVVDGDDDPAARALRGLQRELPRLQVALSDPHGAGQGAASGKIAAMLTGAARADPTSEVLVFADADARPTPTWLASLVAPLGDPAVGGSTGFAWYMAATRARLRTALRDAWVATVLDGMSYDRFRPLWGGSMAVRRADFDRSTIRKEWSERPADDAGLTAAVKSLGLKVAFAPGALVASPEDWEPGRLLPWMARQYALTRVAKPAAFRLLLILHGLHTAALFAGVALLAGAPSSELRGAGLLLVLPTGLEVVRASVRARLVARALPAARAQPLGERALQRLLAATVSPLVLLALLRARRMTRFQWHGRTYELGVKAEGR